MRFGGSAGPTSPATPATAARRGRMRPPRRARRVEPLPGPRADRRPHPASAGRDPVAPTGRPSARPGRSRPSRPAPTPPAPAPCPPVDPGSPFQLPPLELLEPPAPFPIQEHEAKIHARAMLLERTLLDFGYQVRVVQIDTGPVITQFEIELEAGLRVSRIMSLADDLAIALAVPSVRIVAPIPGKTTVGIEVPNDRRGDGPARRGDRGRRAEQPASCKIPLFLGKDVKGIPLVFDLADMPHLLIAGRTGTGKSVCLNAMILSILMTKRPDEVKLILIDPKMVELSQFKRDPAPDAPGRHRHEEGRVDPGLGLRQDGRAVRLPRPRRGPEHPDVQPARRRRDPRPAPARGRRGAAADPDLHALHRDHRRRDGRPDDDRRPRRSSSTSSAWPRRPGRSACT